MLSLGRLLHVGVGWLLHVGVRLLHVRIRLHTVHLLLARHIVVLAWLLRRVSHHLLSWRGITLRLSWHGITLGLSVLRLSITLHRRRHSPSTRLLTIHSRLLYWLLWLGLGLSCWLLSWRLNLGTLARVYQNVVLLQISCEFVVLNTLLKFDESLVKLRVELAALFKHILKIVLGDYSLVQYLKEHHSFWILRLLADKRSERTHVLLNRLSQLLTLCLEFIISSEVLHVFL